MKERLTILEHLMRFGLFYGYNSQENKDLDYFIYKNPYVWNETYLEYNFLRLSMHIENTIKSKFLNEENPTV